MKTPNEHFMQRPIPMATRWPFLAAPSFFRNKFRRHATTCDFLILHAKDRGWCWVGVYQVSRCENKEQAQKFVKSWTWFRRRFRSDTSHTRSRTPSHQVLREHTTYRVPTWYIDCRCLVTVIIKIRPSDRSLTEIKTRSGPEKWKTT